LNGWPKKKGEDLNSSSPQNIEALQRPLQGRGVRAVRSVVVPVELNPIKPDASEQKAQCTVLPVAIGGCQTDGANLVVYYVRDL
jgi:hypothetical protein